MEAQCSVATPLAKKPKRSDIGMAQPDEPMDVSAAGTCGVRGMCKLLYSLSDKAVNYSSKENLESQIRKLG